MTIERTRLDKIYEENFWNDDTPSIVPDDIFSFSEIRSCADIYRMYSKGFLKIQPDFQRDVIWKGPDVTRFIDSIVKQLPIPSLCFSYDSVKQEWLVIDGLQRISTLIKFFERESDFTFSTLRDVDQRISGKRLVDVCNDYPDIVSRIENASLPITVLRCDFSNGKHLAYLFTIFHRLNSTGVKLNNQEIRNCLYAGSFNDLLRELDCFDAWRQLNRMKKDDNERMKKQELILRFFAFREGLTQYEGNLTSFLNNFMKQNRSVDSVISNLWTGIFKDTVTVLNNLVQGGVIEKKRLSMVMQDALLYGISKNLDNFKQKVEEVQKDKITRLLNDVTFSEQNMSEGIFKKDKLLARLNAADCILR